MGKNGNVGNKNSGRRPLAIEARKIINMNLANEIGNQELKRIEKTPIKKRAREDLKEIVMPVVLKGMTDKKELSGNIKLETITGMVIKKEGGGA